MPSGARVGSARVGTPNQNIFACGIPVEKLTGFVNENRGFIQEYGETINKHTWALENMARANSVEDLMQIIKLLALM